MVQDALMAQHCQHDTSFMVPQGLHIISAVAADAGV